MLLVAQHAYSLDGDGPAMDIGPGNATAPSMTAESLRTFLSKTQKFYGKFGRMEGVYTAVADVDGGVPWSYPHTTDA